MLSFADYRKIIHNLIDYRSSNTSYISTTQALQTILAESIYATFPLPPFANSSMDGYALISADTSHAQASTPTQLTVASIISAGVSELLHLQTGQVARIFTGAPIPPGADCVIKQEDCRINASGQLEIFSPVEKGNYIRPRGCDMSQGTEVLSPGSRLNPRRLGILSALGITQIQVYRPFSIILITTGDEIVTPGQQLSPYQFYDSISSMISAACQEINAVVVQHYHCPDDPAQLLYILDNLATPCDLVLCIGGASVGDKDIAKLALAQYIQFYKVAMQPGMPQGCGKYPNKHGMELTIICLPGNPVSAYVSFEMFIRPAILSAQQCAEKRPIVPAILQDSVTCLPDKLQIRRGYYRYPQYYPKQNQGLSDESEPDIVHESQPQNKYGTVLCLGPAGSHHQRWLAEANCFILFPPASAESTSIAAGTLVQAFLLEGITEEAGGVDAWTTGAFAISGKDTAECCDAGGVTEEVAVTK